MGNIKAVFVGTGMIGAGLAANAMLNGYQTVLYDVVPHEKMRQNISHILDILVGAGAATREQADAALNACHFSNDLEDAVKGANFVQECIPERLELKKSTYATIQKVTGPDAIICSSTSKLFPTKLQEGSLYPQSILVGHPYNPAYLLPLIELCGGEQTAPEAIEKAKEIYTGMGKVAVVCKKEIYGFIVNRLSWAALDAAKECVRDGVCSVEDMDKAIMFGPGMRMAVTGQLLTISLGVEGGFRAIADKYGEESTGIPPLATRSTVCANSGITPSPSCSSFISYSKFVSALQQAIVYCPISATTRPKSPCNLAKSGSLHLASALHNPLMEIEITKN